MEIFSRSEFSDVSKFNELFQYNSYLNISNFFKSEFWIAFENNQYLGQLGCNLNTLSPDEGYIGFLNTSNINDTKTMTILMNKALEWLHKYNVKKVYGPINFCTWFNYRYRIKEELPLFSWEPQNPIKYLDYFYELGFKPTQYYHSHGYKNLSHLIPITEKYYLRSIENGFKYRPFHKNIELFISEDIPLIYKLSLEGFQNNFLFQPIPFELFKVMLISQAHSESIHLGYFVFDQNNTPVGFFYHPIENDYLILKTLVILENYRGRGLSHSLTYHGAQEASLLGIEKFVGALVANGGESEGNNESFYSKNTETLWRHEYILFEKNI